MKERELTIPAIHRSVPMTQIAHIQSRLKNYAHAMSSLLRMRVTSIGYSPELVVFIKNACILHSTKSSALQCFSDHSAEGLHFSAFH